MDIAVRPAAATEAKVLALFSEACFRETFGYLFPDEAMDQLCARAFTPAALAALIAEGAWVAEGPEGWLGYAALSTAPCPLPGLPSPQLELRRLYVAARWHGLGISGPLMEAFLAEARARGARAVWLEAFKGNPRALGFYRRWGFQDLGGEDRVPPGLRLPHRTLGLVL